MKNHDFSHHSHDAHKTHDAHKGDVFTNEEIDQLEKEFIDTYLKNEVKPIKTLLGMYRRYWKQLFISMVFYFIKTSPVLAFPIITSNIINLIVTPPADVVRQLIINVVVMVFLLLLNIPTHVLFVKYYSIVMRRVEAGLRGALVRKLQQLSIQFHKEMQSGRIQSKIMRDVETVHTLSSQLFSTIPGVVINMITALIVVVSKNLTVFFFFLFCIPTAVLTVRLFRSNIKKTNSEFRRGMEETSATLMDMVEMTQITRAHALENKEIKKMTGKLNEIANSGFRLDMVQALFGSCSWVVFHIFQLLCLAFSAWMAYEGAIDIGDISLYQSYFGTLTGQVSTIIGLLPIITKGLESVSSIGEILSSHDIEDNAGKERMPDLDGDYEFRDVHFSYEDDQPILRGLDLHVKKGETIAIVGESGSGKSTLLNLVLGFNLPKSGEVLIDGKDVNKINLHSYRRHIAIVPQNSVLFTGTIRENITYGISKVSEKRLWEVIEAARLREFIEKLPHGLDTVIEEKGANLSGGQRQRISIARAIIRDPRVIIFDEATSALDSVSEREIQAAINNMTRDRTTFIVAHRLSTIKDADRIAVIKDGKCVEIGSFTELMAIPDGEFYKMQSAQSI